ncbi:MAG TPA: hypothetical protein VFH58_05570 [Acidimicrobiales bacterium]|nr:hypothetical protein [Acidimicrobiales bacterium]
MDYFSPEGLLLSEVVSVLRQVEAPPAAVLAGAKTAYGWRSVVLAVADLEFDSAVDDDDLARVRTGTSERLLRFRTARTVAELSVIDGGRRIVGRLHPPIPGVVMLRHPGRPDCEAEVDDLGQFLFENVPRGAVSVQALPADPAHAGFQTEWVTL